jgi:hypothetical protein
VGDKQPAKKYTKFLSSTTSIKAVNTKKLSSFGHRKEN